MNICRRCVVSGKVQGVFFRASTCQKASELGLKGWVRNLQDNSVEIFACGAPEKLDEFTQWLWVGPSQAEVSDVSVLQAEVELHNDFSIRYD